MFLDVSQENDSNSAPHVNDQVKVNTVQNSCQKCVLFLREITMSVAWLSQLLVQPSHRGSGPAMSPASIFHRNSGERFPAHLVTMAAPEASYLIASDLKIQGDLPNSWEKTSCPCGLHRDPRDSKNGILGALGIPWVTGTLLRDNA